MKRKWYAATNNRNADRVAVSKLGNNVLIVTQDGFCKIASPENAKQNYTYILSEKNIVRYNAEGVSAIEGIVSRFYGM